MFRSRPTAASDNRRTCIARMQRVMRHQLGATVEMNLSVDVLISEKSIQELDLFARQFKLSAEDEAAIKLIKETGDPLRINSGRRNIKPSQVHFSVKLRWWHHGY